MRRMLYVGLTGVLAAGCAGADVTGSLPDPGPTQEEAVTAVVTPPANLDAGPGWIGALDDLIERLAPALRPAGAALGAPLRQLRHAPGGRLDAQLLAATLRQFDALAGQLPPDLLPDAEALRLTLDALGAPGDR